MTAPQHPGPASSGPLPPGPGHGTPPARLAPRAFGQPAPWPDAPPDEAEGPIPVPAVRGGFGQVPQWPEAPPEEAGDPSTTGPATPGRRHAAAELPPARGQAEEPSAVRGHEEPLTPRGHAGALPVRGQAGELPARGQAAELPARGYAAELPARGYAGEQLAVRGHAAEVPAVRGPVGEPSTVRGQVGELAAMGGQAGQGSAGTVSGVAGQRYSPTGEFPVVAGPGHAAAAGGGASGFGTAPAVPGPQGAPTLGASTLGAPTPGVPAQGVPAQGRLGPAQQGFGGGGHAAAHGPSASNGVSHPAPAVRAPAAAPPTAEELAAVGELVRRLTYQIESVILGKPQVVRLALTALLAEGHVLLEDVPGVGKTTLARSVAASVQGQWRRIQFTPDLLPSDVTGVTIFNQGTRGFEFHPGPVFANIVIADEINRASPKTQSALLEVMEERYVTVDGVRHGVPRPFLVVATQNPIEMDGTYRLPEAQLDRFLMKLTVGYPSEAVEIEVLRGAAAGRSPESIDPVTDTATIAQVVRLAHRVHIADPLYAYAVRLGAATRVHPQVRVGVSPRGVIALTRAACAFALTDGRPYVVPEDLKALVEPVFAHRLLLSPDAQVRAVTAGDILREVLEAVAVPTPT